MVVYQLVMPEEADAEKGMISTSSPIGRAILNKEEGDEIKVDDAERHPQAFELIKLVTIHDEALTRAAVFARAPDRAWCSAAPARTARITPGCCARCRKPASRSTSSPATGVGAGERGAGRDRRRRAPLGRDGIWRVAAHARRCYGWRWPVRRLWWRRGARRAGALVVLGIVVYPLGFLLRCAARRRRSLARGYAAGCSRVCRRSPADLVPRLALIALIALGGSVRAAERRGAPRARRGWWWRLLGAPLDAAAGPPRCSPAPIWQLIRGAAPLARPAPAALGRRYARCWPRTSASPGSAS